MRLERKKNTVQNAIWGIINRIIALFGPFAVRTLIIYTMGTEYLGLSSLFSSILQVLNMADLGFSSAVAYCMYVPVAEDDSDTICALLNLFRKVYKIVGIVILVIGLMLMPFLKYLISGDVPADINIYWLYILYLMNTSISYLLCAYRSVLFSAFQREDVISKVYSALLIAEYAGQITVLIFLKNYYAYYIIVPVISVLNNIWIYILSKKSYPEYQPKGDIADSTKQIIKEKMSGIVISKFCGLTRNTFDSIIISAFAGLTAVAIYGNYYYILSNLSALLVIIVTSMRAGIGNSIVMDSVDKNYRDFNKFSFIYMWCISWCTICLLCLYQPFMKLWVHEENMFPFYMVVLFSIYFFGLCIGDIIESYSGAAGLWWENRRRSAGEAITNLVLNIAFGYFFGVFGIVLATIITLFLCNFIWKLFILFKYYFKEYSPWKYLKTYLGYIGALVISGSITLFICSLIDVNDFYNLILRGMICIILPNAIMYALHRKNKRFTEAAVFVSEIVKEHMRRN